MNTLKKVVNTLFWLAIVLWALNFLLESNTLALVIDWSLPILLVASILLSTIWKGPRNGSSEVDPDNLAKISDAEFRRLEEEKPNLQTWTALHDGKEIVVTNWFSVSKAVGAAELIIDGKSVSRSTAMTHDHQKPLLESFGEEAGGFHTEVFFTGFFKVKAAIVVNGTVILRDKASILDRLVGKALSYSRGDK